MTPAVLDELLNALPHDSTVAIRDGCAIDAGRMRAWAQRVASALRSVQPVEAHRTGFAFGRDRAAFAAALFGTWSAGYGAALPADARRELVVPCLRTRGTGALLHDTGVGSGVHVPPLFEEGADVPAGSTDAAAAALAPAGTARGVALASVLMTLMHDEGTTRSDGDPEASHGLVTRAWTAAEVLDELDRLERDLEWPNRGAVVATVAPSSLPGVLLGVLLPLRERAPFASAVPTTPADVAREVRSASARVLVSTPGHLRGIVALPAGSLGALEVVVSTWDPLEGDLRDELERRHGVRVCEVLVRESSPALSLGARGLRSALFHTEGVEDSVVAEIEGSIAAWIQAPRLDRAALVKALAARGVRLPQHVAWVERMPRDPNGSVSRAAFWRRFGLGTTGRALPLDLAWSTVPEEDRGVFRVAIPTDSAWFHGHFPGHPILAGAVQLQEIVLPALRRIVGGGVRVRAWSALKFLGRIVPGDVLTVECALSPDGSKAKFAIRRTVETCTTGTVEFERAAADEVADPMAQQRATQP